MPAHSCIAIWLGPEKRSYRASTEISFREASGPENEKSNLRLPSWRAWKPRYRTVDFGSFIVSSMGEHNNPPLLQCGKYFCHIRLRAVLEARIQEAFRNSPPTSI